MPKSAVLCACVVLAVTSLVNGGITDPIVSNLSGPTPECPLSSSDLEKLKQLTFRQFDASEMLMGPFTELWSSQFAKTTVPYCLKTYVTRSVENNMLKQITVVKNTNSHDQGQTITYLQKLEENVFLVRKSGDMTPIARIYIIYAHKNALATFQCSLTPLHPVRQLLKRLFSPPQAKSDSDLPDDYLMPKMATIAIPQSVVTHPLQPSVETPLNEAWEIISKNTDLFGRPAETEPCILEQGDIEQGDVKPSQ